MATEELVYVGFNSKVAALYRNTGEIKWKWDAEKGSGFVSLLLDGDRLYAAVNGYTYCLDPRSGEQMWMNPMKGFGYGTTSIATARGHTPHTALGQEAAAQAAAASSATAAH